MRWTNFCVVCKCQARRRCELFKLCCSAGIAGLAAFLTLREIDVEFITKTFYLPPSARGLEKPPNTRETRADTFPSVNPLGTPRDRPGNAENALTSES